ncbi:MAG: hypothetical protein GTO41_13055, partial [Burkholderiales bacterium]|nr:hypothetical protein [Burkholderiales bacterium]
EKNTFFKRAVWDATEVTEAGELELKLHITDLLFIGVDAASGKNPHRPAA